MRKHLIGTEENRAGAGSGEWLNLERVAEVELTSEDAAYPVESVFAPGDGRGWRAGAPGAQTIRLVFDEPMRLERIRLVFEETDTARTQEMVLRWASGLGEPPRDVVRQQYNFHPPGNAREVEDYVVDLAGVKVLELIIIPEVAGGPARASLREWLVR